MEEDPKYSLSESLDYFEAILDTSPESEIFKELSFHLEHLELLVNELKDNFIC